MRFQDTTPSAAPAASSTPDARSTTFTAGEAEKPDPDKDILGGKLLVEAYAVLWVILMVWLGLVWRKQRALHNRLDDLENVIDKAAAQLDAKLDAKEKR